MGLKRESMVGNDYIENRRLRSSLKADATQKLLLRAQAIKAALAALNITNSEYAARIEVSRGFLSTVLSVSHQNSATNEAFISQIEDDLASFGISTLSNARHVSVTVPVEVIKKFSPKFGNFESEE